MRIRTRKRFTLLALLLSAALPAQGSAVQEAPKAPANPELAAEGREDYFGREIARTMHWSGAEWLMRESREDEEDSSLLLEQLGVQEGQTVCDFGCGNGYYTLPLAERVGAEGRVLAVDLQSEMLSLLQARVRAAGHENVVPVEATLTKTGLEPESCDAILLVDVYHEISHPMTVLAGLRRALKPRGRLLLVEFRLEDPEVPIKLLHKMSKAQMLLEMCANGLRFESEFDGLPWQHLMAFEKDPAFPREEDQAEANGRAVAAGLERALRAGDIVSLSGFYADEVSLGSDSRLLQREEKGNSAHLSHSEWRRRLARHVEAVTRERWRSTLEGVKLGVAPLAEDYIISGGPLTLCVRSLGPDRETPPDPYFEWFLNRNREGQWLVVQERFSH
jgi:ubiquinone/menaquinone biosynthesis C-methylase UbiE